VLLRLVPESRTEQAGSGRAEAWGSAVPMRADRGAHGQQWQSTETEQCAVAAVTCGGAAWWEHQRAHMPLRDTFVYS